jgi:heme-degrading monooxygenase HmoA
VFARVSQVQYPPQHYDAGLRVVVEDLVPALRRVPGYQGCCLLTDGKPGTGLSVVLWASEEAADAATSHAPVTDALRKLLALGLLIEARKIYEVAARDAWGSEAAPANREIPPQSG